MSLAVDAVKRAALREVRDELLRRARTCERARDHFVEQRDFSRAALEDRSASVFRQSAQLADEQLRDGLDETQVHA